ncbi:MAG TPA: prolyl oligopeptidase family serine peptidase, partial [Candidatus Baltobacteraceae bacterium]|nr:prolyl oligopeptidase family serine peptidase [Candidatus Baltobacteraceae bacterium]
MNRFVLCAALCAAVVFSGARAGANPTMQDVYRATLAIHDLGDVGLSPDGAAVVWQESYSSMQGANDTRRREALYVQRIGEASSTRLTAGNASQYYDEENPVWSPDGTRIAFLSDAGSARQLQVYLADPNGAHVQRLTKLEGNVQALRWLPNGAALSVLYIPNAHRASGALAPGARDIGVVGETVDEQRLAKINLSTGAATILTPATDYVYEYDWSPSGAQAALTYARGNGDNNWWIAKLATVPAAGGAMHDVLAPAYQINDPQWSPNGKEIAFIGGIMSDFGSVGGDVYVIDPATHEARDASAGMTMSASSLHWVNGSTIDMTAHANGTLKLAALNVATGKVAALAGDGDVIRSLAVSRNGNRYAFVRTSFSAAPEIWAGTLANLRQITHVNAGARRLYGKAVSLNWKSDQFNVQGWLIYPLNYDASKKYPMVTVIHGGPSAESLPNFGYRTIAAFCSQGYFVFEPNPRGSFGQGEAFTAANVKDFGYGDWRDDLAGVDAALAHAPIDPNRLGLWGWSYGGYMGMWAETQTTRFKAIVAGAGIVNWQSYYGQKKIDRWMIPFFGASVYDDPAVYAKSSPITFIKQSHTPVLILQGELGEEVPAPQAFEF